MDAVLEFLLDWTGLIAVAVILVVKAIYDYEKVTKLVRDWIFLAEERATEYALEHGKQKKQWVIEHGYKYLPAWMKLVVGKRMFGMLVQNIFDKIKKWLQK